MKNEISQAGKYILNVASWVSIEYGERFSEKFLANWVDHKDVFEKYNAAYNAFVSKHLSSSDKVKEVIMEKMCGDFFIYAVTKSHNEKIKKMLNN